MKKGNKDLIKWKYVNMEIIALKKGKMFLCVNV